jgi:hypothetical protein
MVTALSLLGTAVSVGTGGPAVAAPHGTSPPSVQIGYTDSATPRQAYDWAEGVNMPLGARVDEAGEQHVSRVYATFDLAGFEGRTTSGAWVQIRESTAADCTLRAIEVWRTRPVEGTPTWRRPPAPLTKVDEIADASFCPGRIIFDVDAAVRDAVTRKQRRITFEIRVPEQHETDPAYGRSLNWYTSVLLSVEYNTPPTVDEAHLYNAGVACSQLRPYPRFGWRAANLGVRGLDADEDDERALRAEVELWPRDDPAARLTLSSDNGISGRVTGVQIPDGTLVDGRTYVWRARVGDGSHDSAWSRRCFFTYDGTRPSAPTVSSANYPRAEAGRTPLGELGRFTFDGHGDRDVAGFRYTWSEPLWPDACDLGEYGQSLCPDPLTVPGTARANAPGGSATVILNPPGYGSRRLTVQSIDAAGNVSAVVTYEIDVPASWPRVELLGERPEWGDEVRLRFSPRAGLTGVQEYEYRLDGNDPETVYADEDGYAYLTFQASDPSGHRVDVRSVGANGFRSDTESWSVSFDPWPGVLSAEYPSSGQPVGGVGVPGTFAFSPPPGWTEVAAYRYTFDDFASVDEVAADADGRASVLWTPTRSGRTTLTVFALRADGTSSDYANWYAFEVAEAPEG